MRVYAIGDVHGQYEMLRTCHNMIKEDRARIGDPDACVVHLGDYTDRGLKSRQVLDYLIAGLTVGEPWICLKGNHDRMFRMFRDDPHIQDHVLRADLTWLHERLGGNTTLASYGINLDELSVDQAWENRDQIPDAHWAFLDGLETVFQNDDLYFTHAGIKPGVPLDQQIEDDLIWIRKPFHDDQSDHGKLIVHGHTPVDQPTHYGNRVNLDTGAGYGKPMTAAVFEGRNCWVLGPKGRTPLVPKV